MRGNRPAWWPGKARYYSIHSLWKPRRAGENRSGA